MGERVRRGAKGRDRTRREKKYERGSRRYGGECGRGKLKGWRNRADRREK